MIHNKIIDKMDFNKIKNFCSVKDTVKTRQATDWEEILAKDTKNVQHQE